MGNEAEKKLGKKSQKTSGISINECVLRCVQLFATLWTVTYQTPLFMGFSRQKYWSGLPCPLPEDLPHPGIKLASLMSPAVAGGLFTTSTMWEN